MKLLFAPKAAACWVRRRWAKPGSTSAMDVVAMVIQKNGTVYDLEEAELSYAPAVRQRQGPGQHDRFRRRQHPPRRRSAGPLERLADAGAFRRANALGARRGRNPSEVAAGAVPGTVNIPLGELRVRLSELPRDREIWVHCGVGQRLYYASRILRQPASASAISWAGSVCTAPACSRAAAGNGEIRLALIASAAAAASSPYLQIPVAPGRTAVPPRWCGPSTAPCASAPVPGPVPPRAPTVATPSPAARRSGRTTISSSQHTSAPSAVLTERTAGSPSPQFPGPRRDEEQAACGVVDDQPQAADLLRSVGPESASAVKSTPNSWAICGMSAAVACPMHGISRPFEPVGPGRGARGLSYAAGPPARTLSSKAASCGASTSTPWPCSTCRRAARPECLPMTICPARRPMDCGLKASYVRRSGNSPRT